MKEYRVYVRYDYTREMVVFADNEEIAEDIALQEAIDNPIDVGKLCEPYADDVEEVEK